MRLKAGGLLVGVLCALLAMTTGAGRASGTESPTDPDKPQLLLFHGGAFLFNDGSFEERTRERAIAAGFEPHYVEYPLGDLPGAVEAAAAAAAELDAVYGTENVYAYGASAGGVFAALLAERGLVAGAAAKAPPSDLTSWTWPYRTPYAARYRADIATNPATLRRLSPLFAHRVASPLLIVQGVGDRVVPPQINERFARRSGHVELWRVPGGHWTERERPYLISESFRWLLDQNG